MNMTYVVDCEISPGKANKIPTQRYMCFFLYAILCYSYSNIKNRTIQAMRYIMTYTGNWFMLLRTGVSDSQYQRKMFRKVRTT